MNRNTRIIIGVVAVGLMMFWKGVFATMPQITSAGLNQIQVGPDASHRTCYELGSEADLEGTIVDYSGTGMLGGGFLADMGGRKLLSYMNPDSYAAAVAQSKRGRQCFGQCLSSHGVWHYILIPRDEAALKQMMSAHFNMGSRFRMSGRRLALLSFTQDGQRMSVGLGPTGCFLVSSISSRD